MAHILPGSDGHYLLAVNRQLSHITYDVSQSFMLSCGSRDYRSSARDAGLLSSALAEAGLLERAHLRLCCSDEECTSDAMQSAFKTQASRVRENGLFLFSYHGPEISCTTIQSWLRAVSPQPPKQVVFFLDSPSAIETAKSLTNPLAVVTGIEKFCVFCANPQPCSSELTSTLGHSLFSFFTARAIRKCTPTPNSLSQRLLYVSDISSLVRVCCAAVRSLCVSETDSSGPGVMSLRTQPLRLLQQYQDDGSVGGEDMIDGAEEEEEGEDEVDGSTVARFSFVGKFYQTRRKKKRPKLCDMAHRWLEYLKHGDTSPLHILHNHELLCEMFTGLLRLLVYSLALMQDTQEHSNTGDPNTVIVVYVQAVGVLELVAATELPASAEQFALCCEAYCLALEQRKTNTSKVKELAKKVIKENK